MIFLHVGNKLFLSYIFRSSVFKTTKRILEVDLMFGNVLKCHKKMGLVGFSGRSYTYRCSGGYWLPRPGASSSRHSPRSPSGQGLAARACPTTPARSRAARGHQGSPSPRHRAPSGTRDRRGQGQAERWAHE